MYTPKVFKEEQPEIQYELIRNYPLGLLISQDEEGAVATPIPFHLSTNGSSQCVLQGHLARANPAWKNLHGQDVLVVFQGDQAYISPSWYPSKAEHGKVVPTWNYIMVQVRGAIRVIDDERWLREQLTKLTHDQEAHRETPWQVTDAPDDYINREIKQIIGIEIEIRQISGKWKVSQNQSITDSLGVIEGLTLEGKEDMASLVRVHQRSI